MRKFIEKMSFVHFFLMLLVISLVGLTKSQFDLYEARQERGEWRAQAEYYQRLAKHVMAEKCKAWEEMPR